MELSNREVLIVGLGETGMATAEFLNRMGASVTITDVQPQELLGQNVHKIKALGVNLELGRHCIDTFLRSDLIILSPGISWDIIPVKEAMKKGIETISELELAFRFLTFPLIAVTGTNGKTTTATLIYEILKFCRKKVFLAGNIGIPLIKFALEKNWDYGIVEVSSFQLEGVTNFKPKIAILLNITQDHLDRHRTMEDYVSAKMKIFSRQTEEDWAIWNDDLNIALQGKGKKIPFSSNKELKEGIFLSKDSIFCRIPGSDEIKIGIDRVQLKGIHNLENIMAVIATGLIVGSPPDIIQNIIENFKPLPHRMEFVGEVRGIRYYNDSKATNVDATVKAILSFDEPIVMIAGGEDKNSDFRPMRSIIKDKVRALVLMGRAKDKMKDHLDGITDITTVDSLEEAMNVAELKAKPGDVVLFSPACASFDMFKNYKERGEKFRQKVAKILYREG